MYSCYEKALKNLIWNIHIFSSRLWVHIAIFETTLRNCIHQAMVQKHSTTDWWNIHGVLRKQERARIHFLQRQNSGDPLNGENLMARAPFGFWLNLLSRNYHDRVWKELVLNNTKLGEYGRKKFHADVSRIKGLRDALAHHLPILQRNIERDLQLLDESTARLSSLFSKEIYESSKELRKMHAALIRQ